MSPAKPPAERSRLKNVALFTGEDEVSSNPQTVPLTKIKFPNQQPRRYFDPQKLAGLVESIKQHGILEPLLVRPVGSAYELVAGERRYRAAKDAGLRELPVVIREMNDADALQIALIENLQREDLNPVEETEGILQLLALELGKPEAEVVSLLHRMLDETKGKVPHNVMGNSETQAIQKVFDGIALMEWSSFVSNRLPLLKLPEDILNALREGRIAYTKAQAISRIKDPSQRESLLEEAVSADLSLSQIKEKINAIKPVSDDHVDSAPSLKQQFDQTYRQVKKSKVWDDPKKKKRLEKLLADLNALLVNQDG
ncbi:MAG: ParB/RepB/Spo0J family partition protein [Oculatellaceae cyanobacterium bins.114]|nr:ParB/RepB/Spo0J family partition protein [Oculatellaceae cyanobacterium bins.114]